MSSLKYIFDDYVDKEMQQYMGPKWWRKDVYMRDGGTIYLEHMKYPDAAEFIIRQTSDKQGTVKVVYMEPSSAKENALSEYVPDIIEILKRHIINRASAARMVSAIGLKHRLPPSEAGPVKYIHEYLGYSRPQKFRNSTINRNYKNFSGIPFSRGGKTRKQRGGQTPAIKNSKIHGAGVFATKNYRANEFVFMAITRDKKITPMGSKINHCPSTSKKMNTKLVRRSDGWWVKTIVPVDADEELTTDYNETPDFIAKAEPRYSQCDSPEEVVAYTPFPTGEPNSVPRIGSMSAYEKTGKENVEGPAVQSQDH